MEVKVIMGDLVTFSCPSCGGLLELSEGNTNTVCGSCDTPLLIEGIVNRYIVDAAISATGSVRSVRRKLESMSKGVFSECRVRKPFLAYVPFWILSARVDGYVFGVKPIYRERKVKTVSDNDDGSGGGTTIKTIKQRKGVRAEEHQISNGFDVIVSAANLEPLGIPSLGSKSQMGLSGMCIGKEGAGLSLKVFNSEDFSSTANVVDPAVSISQAKEEADKHIERICSGVGVGLEQRSMYLTVTGRREKLIHYPLWVVEYALDNRTFRVIVDGYSGEVLRGTFPPDSSHWEKVCNLLGSIWAGLVPIILLIFISGLHEFGPVLMLILLTVYGITIVSGKFLKMAEKNAGMDSYL